MRVYIRYFQCHVEKNLEFEQGEHCLISGESGKGKSTIFRAITWCLYGEGKDVAPTNLDNARTSVMVELAGLRVFRQHNPCLFQVQVDDKLYEGIPAENILEARLGNYQIWMCTTYMLNNFENPLISAVSKKRIQYLDTLSFNYENPFIFLQNIELEISTIKKRQDMLESNIKFKECSLAEYMNKNRINWNEYLPPDRILQLDSNLRETKLSIEQKNSYSQSLRDKIVQRETLVTRITNLEGELRLIPVITLDIVKQKEEQYQLFQKRCEINDKLRLIPEKSSTVEYTPEQIEECKTLEYKRAQMLKLCLSLNIEYTKDCLKYKTEWESVIEWLEYNTLYREITELERQISIIENTVEECNVKLGELQTSIEIPELPPIPNLAQTLKVPVYPEVFKLPHPDPPHYVSLDRPPIPKPKEIVKPKEPDNIVLPKPSPPIIPDIKEIQTEMQLLLLGKQLLHCPACASTLRLNSGILQIASNTPEWNQDKYQELQSQLETYERNKREFDSKMEEIVRTEKKLNAEAVFKYLQEINKLEENEKILHQGLYNIELKRIKDEEYRQNKLLKDEYQSKLSQILQEESTENKRRMKEYMEEKTKYDELLKQEQEEYQRKMNIRANVIRQEQYRINQCKLLTEKLEFNKSQLVDKKNLLAGKRSIKIKLPSKMDKPNVSIESPEVLRKKISEISPLEWIEPILVSSKQMKETNIRLKLEDELSKIKEVKPITLQELNMARQQLEKYTLLVNEISKLRTEIEKIPNCKEEYDSIQISIVNMNSSVREMEYYMVRAKLCSEAYSLWQTIEGMKLEYKKQGEHMNKHQLFKEILMKLESQYYFDLITTINKYLDVHTSYLFELDIRVQLSFTRKLKSGKDKKELHLNITRDGMNVNYISLSDGERAKVNLLLTCALNQLSSNGLLIIDETLSCLDLENKQKCMRFISRQLNGITLLMVNHEANDGDYTRKIDI